MNKVLRIAIISLLAVMFTGFKMTSALIANNKSQITGKIVFATQRTDKANSTLRSLADRFMKLYPGTIVEIEGINDRQSLTTRAAARELPDVFAISSTADANYMN